jgi:hypothetical protein
LTTVRSLLHFEADFYIWGARSKRTKNNFKTIESIESYHFHVFG